nr:hypothetical protein [uncultured Lachnoclostridium sp.]
MEELRIGDLVEIAGFVYDIYGDLCSSYKPSTKGFVIDISANSFGEKIYRVDPLGDNKTYLLCGADVYYLRKELRKCDPAETEEE